MTKSNDPINPIADLNNHPSDWYGLTKREYFAAMAMQAILSKPVDNIKQAAKESVIAADALIKALNEPKSKENEIQTNQQDNG